MRGFFAIFGATVRQLRRSKVFGVLFVLLFLWCLGIPLFIADTDALDFIRVALLYSTTGIHLFLGCCSVWLGCSAVDSDMESGQLTLVAVKPVSRLTVFAAKYTAVVAVNLLLLAAAEGLVFGLIQWRFNRGNFSAEEKMRIRNEVMVGRRVYTPKRLDYAKIADGIVRRRLAESKETGRNVDLTDVIQMRRSAEEEAMAADSEMRYGFRKEWRFDALPTDRTEALTLRYRLYLNRISGENQRSTRLLWLAGMPRADVPGQGAADFVYQPLTEAPEQLQSGVFTERSIPAQAIAPDGTLRLDAVNFDEENAPLFIQAADGPKILIPVCSFAGNFLRMTLVGAISILILAALGCSFAAFFSLPTAIFLSAAYLLIGAVSALWAEQDYFSGFFDEFGYHLAKTMLFFVVPLRDFDVTDLVADGELVEYATAVKLFLYSGIGRTLPLFLLGALVYRRRELAKAVRR